MSSVIQVRVHPVLKAEVELLCNRMGMSLSEAVRLFLNQVWLEKKIPFEIHIPRKFFTIRCNDDNRSDFRPDLRLEVADLLRQNEPDDET